MTIMNLTDAYNMTVAISGDQGATILSPMLFFGLGVLGNILAIVTLHRKNTNIITAKFYTLVRGLAWTDLAGILITTPSVLLTYMNQRQWLGGDVHCVFHGFTMTCFALVTPLILCAMAIERFMAIKFVFCYTIKYRKSTARYVIFSIWICVLIYGTFPFLGFGAFELEYPGTWCFLDFHSKSVVHNVYAYIFASVNILLIAIMIICNGFVIVTLIAKRMCAGRHDGWSSPRKQLPTISRKAKVSLETQMIVLLCSITTVFVLCWAPLMIQIILTTATGKTNQVMDLLAIRLASLNQTLDPWLYILLRRSFCARISRYAKRIWKPLTNSRTPTHSNNAHAGMAEHHRMLELDNAQQNLVRAEHVPLRSISSHKDKRNDDIPDVAKVNDEPEHYVYRVSFINRHQPSGSRSCKSSGTIDINMSLLPRNKNSANNSQNISSRHVKSAMKVHCCSCKRMPASSEDRCIFSRTSQQQCSRLQATEHFQSSHSPRAARL